MPDISMCYNKGCPLSETCYRLKAKPNPYRQAYGDFQYSLDANGKPVCEHYIKLKVNENDGVTDNDNQGNL